MKKTTKLLDNGKFWQYFHGGLVVFWIALWVFASITGLVKSVAFISHLSIVALVLASASSWQAARVERKEDDGSGSSHDTGE